MIHINDPMKRENQNNGISAIDGAGRKTEADKFDHSKYVKPENENGAADAFPGYPHYPPSEDIMNPANHVERVPVDVENLAPPGTMSSQASQKNPENAKSPDPFTPVHASTDDDIRIVPGGDADVTREELHLLKATEGDYENTMGKKTVTGEDLDVPGAELDDPNEDIGEEDEENNYYSLGGDNHENLEEDPS
jgi:hypothetical protein